MIRLDLTDHRCDQIPSSWWDRQTSSQPAKFSQKHTVHSRIHVGSLGAVKFLMTILDKPERRSACAPGHRHCIAYQSAAAAKSNPPRRRVWGRPTSAASRWIVIITPHLLCSYCIHAHVIWNAEQNFGACGWSLMDWFPFFFLLLSFFPKVDIGTSQTGIVKPYRSDGDWWVIFIESDITIP